MASASRRMTLPILNLRGTQPSCQELPPASPERLGPSLMAPYLPPKHPPKKRTGLCCVGQPSRAARSRPGGEDRGQSRSSHIADGRPGSWRDLLRHGGSRAQGWAVASWEGSGGRRGSACAGPARSPPPGRTPGLSAHSPRLPLLLLIAACPPPPDPLRGEGVTGWAGSGSPERPAPLPGLSAPDPIQSPAPHQLLATLSLTDG